MGERKIVNNVFHIETMIEGCFIVPCLLLDFLLTEEVSFTQAHLKEGS